MLRGKIRKGAEDTSLGSQKEGQRRQFKGPQGWEHGS